MDKLTRLARREIRFPVRTASGHDYEASIKIQMVRTCEEGNTPSECMELWQDEMESIVEDMKKGMAKPEPKVVTATEVEQSFDVLEDFKKRLAGIREDFNIGLDDIIKELQRG